MAVLVPEIVPGSGNVSGLSGAKSARRRGRIIKNLELYVPLGGFVLMILVCFLVPLVFTIPNPNQGNPALANLPPLSPGHILGTDTIGNDVMSRILYGGRLSLEVGLGSQGIGLVVGSMIGMFSGFRGGIVDSIIMRIMDMLIAFPGLVIALMIATYLGPSELHVIYAISFFSIPAMARLSRAQTLRLRERDFIVSSRLYGEKDSRILIRHIAPNVYPQLLTFVCLGIGIAIIVEASLSFLGLGVPPPAPTWGNMIAAGEENLANPYLIIVPGAFLFFTILCLNLLGDAVRSRVSAR